MTTSHARRAADRICRGLTNGHKIEVPGLAADIEKAIIQEHASVLTVLKGAQVLTAHLATDLEQRKPIHNITWTTKLRACQSKLTAAIEGMEAGAKRLSTHVSV